MFPFFLLPFPSTSDRTVLTTSGPALHAFLPDLVLPRDRSLHRDLIELAEKAHEFFFLSHVVARMILNVNFENVRSSSTVGRANELEGGDDVLKEEERACSDFFFLLTTTE